jgi:hypothetical protein
MVLVVRGKINASWFLGTIYVSVFFSSQVHEERVSEIALLLLLIISLKADRE